MVRERDNVRQEQAEQLLKVPEISFRVRTLAIKFSDDNMMTAVMGDITDAVVFNMEYEASIKVHQGRELNMYKKPEMREMMIKTNPDGKHDEVNVVRDRDNVRQGQAEQLLKVTEISFRVRTLAIKSFGDTVFENTLDKDPGRQGPQEGREEGRGSRHQPRGRVHAQRDGREQRGEEATVREA